MNPRVSICIPTYNQAQYIRECIQSALRQTSRDIEVVVSVNHCTDNTEDIIKEFTDSRLRVIRPDHFLPAGDNFKFCISRARGVYFSYLCSDDLLYPEYVESQMKIMDRYPRVDFVHCAAERINEAGRYIRLEKSILPSFVRNGNVELKRYIDGPKCVGDACLIRRSAYEAIVDEINPVFFWDWELSLLLLMHGDIAYNQRVLIKYRDWTDEYRAGERRWEHFETWVAFYEKYQPEILKLHPGWLARFKRARKKAALSAITAFVDSPLHSSREIEDRINRMSDSRAVRCKLFLVTMGMGFIWRWKKGAINWLRNRIKPLLFALSRKRL